MSPFSEHYEFWKFFQEILSPFLEHFFGFLEKCHPFWNTFNPLFLKCLPFWNIFGMFDFFRILSYDTKKERGRHDMTSTVMGSYKISSTLLHKLVAKRIVTPSGETRSGVSSNELDAVIYFSTIADAAGNIERFRVSFLSSIFT